MSTAPSVLRSSSSINWLFVGSLALALFVGVGIGAWISPWFKTSVRGGKPPADPAGVSALGVVEPGSGVRDLGPAVPDHILEIHVKEGDTVKEGQLLVVLASNRDATEALALAEAQLKDADTKLIAIEASGKPQIELARLQLEKVKKLGPLEIQAGKDKIDLLKEQQKIAQDYVKRLKLLPEDSVPRQDRQKADLQLQQVNTDLLVAENALKRGEVEQELAVQLAQQQLQAAMDTVETAKKQVPTEVLQKQINQAKARLEATLIKAPIDGRIIRVFNQKGELVGGRPILQMANTNRMTIIAEVYETDIRRVAVGQKAEVRSYVLGADKPLEGEVIRIGSSVARNQVFDIDPKATVDNRVIVVKIRIAEKDAAQLADLIGHQVRVEIRTAP